MVSGGELLRGIQSGYSGDHIVFSGVGKTYQEIKMAIRYDIKSLHIESLPELKKIEKAASLENKIARIALRLNPDIPVSTHKYIRTASREDKFGLNEWEAAQAIKLIRKTDKLSLQGFHIHLGSQIIETTPYEKAFKYMTKFLKKYSISKPAYVFFGGGLWD